MDISKLTTEQRAQLCDNIRTACYHLAECWDALGEAEALGCGDIETDDIQALAGECSPADAAFQLADADILAVLGRAEVTA